MTVARTAARYGALVANRARVVGFLREGERVTGASGSRTWRPGASFEVRAKQVINATGVWTDDTQALVGDRGQFHVRASKGIHLVVPRDRIQSSTGIILRTEKSVLFVIPWGRHWIIGTTDTDWDLDKAHPAASAATSTTCSSTSTRCSTTPLTREDVEGVYAGLRPLLAGESESTSKLSREHVVGAPGARAGRRRRRQVHDVPGDGRGRGRRGGPQAGRAGARLVHRPRSRWSAPRATARCGTSAGALAAGVRAARGPDRAPAEPVRLADRTSCSTWSRADPTLGEPLPGAEDYLRVEVVYAATHEGARHLDDVLARRTRISIETWDRGVGRGRAGGRG